MPPKKYLTEKDLNLFRCLADCGALTSEQARRFYGDVSAYHYVRLAKLEERKYIRRHGKYIEIMTKGLRAVGLDEEPPRLRETWERERRSKIAELYFSLANWNFIPKREVRKLHKITQSMQLGCCIERNQKRYAVYLLRENPHKTTLTGIYNEIRRLDISKIYRAIIFHQSEESLTYFDNINAKMIKEILMLPYPGGIDILRHMDKIENAIAGRFGSSATTGRPFADYEKDRTYYSVLVFNDIIKKKALKEYLESAAKREGREVVIICLAGQSEYFAGQFPGVKQIKIKETWEVGENVATA